MFLGFQVRLPTVIVFAPERTHVAPVRVHVQVLLEMRLKHRFVHALVIALRTRERFDGRVEHHVMREQGVLVRDVIARRARFHTAGVHVHAFVVPVLRQVVDGHVAAFAPLVVRVSPVELDDGPVTISLFGGPGQRDPRVRVLALRTPVVLPSLFPTVRGPIVIVADRRLVISYRERFSCKTAYVKLKGFYSTGRPIVVLYVFRI